MFLSLNDVKAATPKELAANSQSIGLAVTSSWTSKHFTQVLADLTGNLALF